NASIRTAPSSLAARRSRSGFRATRTTSAPSARARRAVSNPIPALPPITTTVCPGSSGARRPGESVVAGLMEPPISSSTDGNSSVASSAPFGEDLRLRLPVRVELCLVAFLPCRPLFRAPDVPVGPAALQHLAQVETQLFHSRPPEEPVAVVDRVDAQAGL